MKQMMKMAVKGVFAKVLLAAAAMMPTISGASTSEKPNGSKVRYFDIVIAYDGMPDEKSVEKFEKVLKHFACGIYACSHGRHKLRNVTIYSNTSADSSRFARYGEMCDIRWVSNEMRPEATIGGDPCLGFVDSSRLFDKEFKKQWCSIKICDKPQSHNYDLTGNGYNSPYHTRAAGVALAHEWGHYHYGVYDEYVDPTHYEGSRYAMVPLLDYEGYLPESLPSHR